MPNERSPSPGLVPVAQSHAYALGTLTSVRPSHRASSSQGARPDCPPRRSWGETMLCAAWEVARLLPYERRGFRRSPAFLLFVPAGPPPEADVTCHVPGSAVCHVDCKQSTVHREQSGWAKQSARPLSARCHLAWGAQTASPGSPLGGLLLQTEAVVADSEASKGARGAQAPGSAVQVPSRQQRVLPPPLGRRGRVSDPVMTWRRPSRMSGRDVIAVVKKLEANAGAVEPGNKVAGPAPRRSGRGQQKQGWAHKQLPSRGEGGRTNRRRPGWTHRACTSCSSCPPRVHARALRGGDAAHTHCVHGALPAMQCHDGIGLAGPPLPCFFACCARWAGVRAETGIFGLSCSPSAGGMGRD